MLTPLFALSTLTALAIPAQAQAPDAPPADGIAPPASILAPTNPPLVRDPAAGTAPLLEDRQLSVVELAAGLAAAVVAVPTTLVLATLIGAAPSNLIIAAVPALLLTAVVPPVAVVGTAWGLGNWLAPGRAAPWWALGATALVQVGLIATAVLSGVSTRQLPTAVVFGAVELVALPTVATTALAATRWFSEDDEPLLELASDGGTP